MSRERVVVTGLSMVTPVGVGADVSFSALLAGKSGARPITLFDTSNFPVRFACEVKDFDAATFVDRKRLKEMERFSEFAMAAAKLAMSDSGLELRESEEPRAGCIIGVGLGGLSSLEETKTILDQKGPTKLSPYSIPRIIGNLAAGHVSIAHRLRGPSYAPASACATGAHAIGEAAEWIRRGRADVMLAGGTEAAVTPIGIGGFLAMHALSRRNAEPERASRPFDLGRDGFVCGEGAGVLVLESLVHAKQRGARIYAELSGYGASSDAFHITNPEPNAQGCQQAMRMALDDAALTPQHIQYLNAHATSTKVGDEAESRGILRVFADHAASGALWVSSTKSMIGHLLGAAGAVEAVISVLALSRGVVPPTINVEQQDPACPLDVVPNTARERRISHVMSNSFGFGGTNATLVFSEV